MQNNNLPVQKTGVYLLVAFGILGTLALTQFFCVAGMLAGISISRWQFPLAVLLSLGLSFYAARSFTVASRLAIRSLLIVILLTAVSLTIAGYFYDTTFDGQWYHQETVIRLKEGFNPEHGQLAIPVDERLINNTNDWCAPDAKSPQAEDNSKPLSNLKYLPLNCFSKGNEIVAAAIYASTGRLETGKAANMLMLLASFFMCLSLFYKVDELKPRSKWLLAFILAFNPISCNELFSFCVDGYGANTILCLFALFALIMLQYNRWYLLALAAVITILVNVKFTMLAFAVIFCAGFVVLIIVYKKWDLLKKVLISGIIAGAVGVFVIGFNPYITNNQRFHTMFFGLRETQEEIDRLTPVALRGHNRLEQLGYSIAAHQGWADNSKHTFAAIARIPFTLNKNDIMEAGDTEMELCGLGPFFSGAILVALVVLVVGAIRFHKTEIFRLVAMFALVVIASVVVVPAAWWLRFVPQLWFFPAVFLLLLYFVSFKGSKILKCILSASLVLNILWSMLVIVFVLFNNVRINHQLAQLKALNKPINILYCNYRNFNSNRIRFAEAGITVTPAAIPNGNLYEIPSSTTKILTPGPLPEVPESFLYKLRKKIVAKSK